MAPLSSPDSSHSRFAGGLCSASMPPTIPASGGFGFESPRHLQRLLQSSAARNEDSSFHRQEQVRQFYLPPKAEASTGLCPSDGPRSSNSSAETAVAEPAGDHVQVDQAFQSYGHGDAGAPGLFPSLMRYNSAPSCMLASLSGMPNSLMNPNSDLGQFLPGNIVAGCKSELKLGGGHDRSLNHIDKQATMAVDRLSSHCNGVVSPHGPYRHQPGSGGELVSQMSVDADDVTIVRSPETLSEVGKTALQSPSSYNPKGCYMYSSTNPENGLQRVPSARDALLRHSSSPAGFLSQVNEEHERHTLASSSGNSSEEGSYDRQGGQGLLNGYAWEVTSNMLGGHLDGPLAARKRTRDVGRKGYLGSLLPDSQKVDTFDNSLLGSCFGLPINSSPESIYITDKVSPDSITCRTRAKRGCATHPRSIAERNRRTKISERMKKLQELVPHMDKQANTAEMLDEVVEYVKSLQRQVKELTEKQSRCNCACGKLKELTAGKSMDTSSSK